MTAPSPLSSTVDVRSLRWRRSRRGYCVHALGLEPWSSAVVAVCGFWVLVPADWHEDERVFVLPRCKNCLLRLDRLGVKL